MSERLVQAPPHEGDAPVEVVAYDESWPSSFESERLLLEAVLAPWLAGPIEHIGSTAVPLLPAKPVIDIMAPVHTLEGSRAAIEAATSAGYVYLLPIQGGSHALVDAADDSVRTFRLYESLRLENAAVQELLARTTEELLSFVPKPEESPARPEPVGWWRGEDNALDTVGGHDGRLVGDVRFVPGHTGQAFAFLPSGYVEVSNALSLEPHTLTVAAWARRDGPPTERAYLLSKGASACIAASYALCTDETGGLLFYVSDGRTVNYSPEASPTLWDNTWHFVAGTYDGQVVRLYVDGTEVGTPTPVALEAIGYQLPDGDSLYLGAYHGTCDLRFDDGQLDEVRVFDRALTAAEISDLYTNET